MAFRKFLTFDDVGMIPKFNNIISRTHTNILTTLGNKTYNYPFVPANMDTVISKIMVDKITKLNGMIIYHRFCSLEEKLELVKNYPNIYMSVGISDDEKKTIEIPFTEKVGILKIIAKNEGEIPSNTVSVNVVDSKKLTPFISKLKTGESISINFKKKF